MVLKKIETFLLPQKVIAVTKNLQFIKKHPFVNSIHSSETQKLKFGQKVKK